MANTTDIEFGNIDSGKTCAVEIKHDDKMKEDTPAYIQVSFTPCCNVPSVLFIGSTIIY